MADGYVNKRDGQDRLILALNIHDRNHIERFKSDIESESIVSDHTIESGAMQGKQYSKIAITSQKLCDDLEKVGCTTCKSLTLKFPDINCFASEDLIRHFIRGYFDGDGSVFISNEKHWRNGTITKVIHYRFVGTKQFLTEVDKHIGLTGGIRQPKGSQACELAYKRDKKMIPFFTYLYKDATIYLERKRDIFVKHIQERCSETIIRQLNLN